MKNWFDHLVFQMRAQPAKPAMVMEDRVVTYGMLHVGIERCARRLAALELMGSAPVAVFIENPIRNVTLCLALFRCGIPSITLEQGQTDISGMALAAVLGDEKHKTLIASRHRFVAISDDWFETDLGNSDLPSGFSDSQQVSRLCLSSGSTGEPKIFKLTVEGIGRLTVGFLGFNWNSLLCLPGLSSSYGFTTACTTLAMGRTLCFSTSPFQSVRMIELFCIDFVMAATEQLLALTRAARKSGAHLPSLRTVEIAGSVPSRALLENAMIYVCNDIYCRYGATETGLMARAPAREVISRPGYAGRVLPGVDMRIVDRSGKPCPPGTVGLVRSRLNLRWDGAQGQKADWIDLGDLGWMNAEGELYIVGRVADAGTLDVQDGMSRHITAVHEAEHLLRLEWDATDAAAALIDGDGVRPQIGIGIVECKDASVEQLQTILRARGIDCEVRLFPMNRIPRTVNGKVNRAQLKSLMIISAGKTHES
jgi:acyl-coenzyme A synthetase/AMP-(fatty) acid ligase